jgi:hypothetical protein
MAVEDGGNGGFRDGRGLSLNPDSYEVVAKTNGRPELHRQVQLDEGARVRVEMTVLNPEYRRRR